MHWQTHRHTRRGPLPDRHKVDHHIVEEMVGRSPPAEHWRILSVVHCCNLPVARLLVGRKGLHLLFRIYSHARSVGMFEIGDS